MAVTQEIVKAWKFLESQINLIKDPILKNSIFAEYKLRALKEWGFFPKTGQIIKKEIQLDDWEKELVEDIEKHKLYEIDTRVEKRKKTNIEAKNRIYSFIERGGRFRDLPEDLQNKHILKLYLDTFQEIITDNIKILEELEKKSLQDPNKNV